MRILHVVASIDPTLGGVSQAVRTLSHELNKAADTTNEIASLDCELFDPNDDPSIPVHRLGPAKTSWAYSSHFLPWMQANASRFDAVIVHGLWLYHGYATAKSLSKLSTPSPKFYIMPHGMLDPYFQSDPSRRLKAIRNRIYWMLIEKHVIHRAAAILFTCQEEMELARLPFAPYHPCAEKIVGLGVVEPPASTAAMRAAFLRKCPQLPSNTSYLLFLSRLHPKKGVDLLVHAYRRWYDEHRGSDCPHLVIAGPLDSDYAEKIQSLANQSAHSGIAPIHFVGMLQGDEKWGAIHGCEAFILPSHQENFGIAVVEAMACKKAVLISNKVNIWREIDSSHGAIVTNDDLNGVITLISNWILLSEDERNSLSTGARAAYEKYFRPQSFSEKFQSALSH